MKKLLKDKRAITLIALVITIVVLIILAAVAINLSLGNNGIFNRAKTAKEQYQNAEDYERIETGKTTNQIDSLVGGNTRSATENGCNPICLMSVNLANSVNSGRAAGDYFASTSFTETKTVDYDTYLERTSNNKWKIKKSGTYIFADYISAYINGSAGIDTSNVLLIGDVNISLSQTGIRYGDEWNRSGQSFSAFIEKDTIIDFKCNIGNGSPRHHTSGLTVYANFK